MKTIKEALEVLGGSAKEIAASLRAKGIRGVVGHSCRCPLSIHLSAEVAEQVRVTPDGARTCSYEGAVSITSFADVSNGSAVSGFVSNFDNRDYPYLISGEVGDTYGS